MLAIAPNSTVRAPGPNGPGARSGGSAGAVGFERDDVRPARLRPAPLESTAARTDFSAPRRLAAGRALQPQQRLEALGVDGRAEQVTLELVAAVVEHEAELLVGLDALGDDPQPEGVPEGDHGGHHARRSPMSPRECAGSTADTKARSILSACSGNRPRYDSPVPVPKSSIEHRIPISARSARVELTSSMSLWARLSVSSSSSQLGSAPVSRSTRATASAMRSSSNCLADMLTDTRAGSRGLPRCELPARLPQGVEADRTDEPGLLGDGDEPAR